MASGAVLSKVCHMSHDCFHHTHTLVWPVYMCRIDSPLTPFFRLVKRRLTKSLKVHNKGVVLVSRLGYLPTYNCMSQSWKGVKTESDTPWQYSPGRKRKNNVIQARSDISYCLGYPSCAVALIQCEIVMGVGLTRLGGGVLPHIGLNFFPV